MRILVLGHSDSAGRLLTPEERARNWPTLIGERLPERLGEPVEVFDHVLMPLASGQLEQAVALVDDFDPELVCLALSPFAFAILTVKSRVKRRWGARGLAAARAVERRFDQLTRKVPFGQKVNQAGRSLTRRTIGADPISTYPEVVGAYAAVLARLSRREQTQVIVMGGSQLSGRIRTKRMAELLERFPAEMQRATAQHRFVWFDTEATVAGPDRERYFLEDGVHRNPLGHERLAEMFLPVVETVARGLRGLRDEPSAVRAATSFAP